ncbi:MAG: chromosomal replication initiator protein [Solirubrobacteraceae bacterium]|nr:chromosomal replication initiator protein [Solirubrobacteraceae bacterium]
MSDELSQTWSEVQAQLRRAVSDSTYENWLAPLQPVALEDRCLIVSAPAEARDWVVGRFGRVLQACVSAALGADVTVDVVRPADVRRRTADEVEPTRPAPEPALNPNYAFDQFVIGDCNRLAHAAALTVAELPGQAYNPLFIYGPPGVGKTHLLHSIGHYVRAHGAGLRVRYATGESFTSAFVGALQTGAVDRFKARFREADVLLLDDVQFLQSKARTEEEFFHTFNALHDTGSQVVVTCDRLPRDLGALEDRLRERFEAGLVADIRAPELLTRLTILRKRAEHDGVVLDEPAALDVIARRVGGNVRALEGALVRVVAFASLTGRSLTAGLAGEVLDSLYGAARPAALSVADIQAATCETFGISREELLSAGRTARVVWPRQVAMHLTRELTDLSLPAIGDAFGGRDHSTVLHACRRATGRVASDTRAADDVRRVAASLSTPADDRDA